MRSCPKCKSSDYNNKGFVLMINECGHSLCKQCVDNLFVRQSAPCPTCGRTLKKSLFWEQTFDDPMVAKEVHFRKKLQKIFNLKEEDFPTLRAYNDYLEQTETYVFNLTHDLDVEDTKRRIDEFQRRHEDLIAKNRNRRSKDDEWIQRQLDEENKSKERWARYEADAAAEFEAKQNRNDADDARAVIAELMNSEMPAEFIVNNKKQQQYLAKIESEKQENENRQQQLTRPSLFSKRQEQIVPLPTTGNEGEPFVYQPDVVELFGPPVPPEEELVSRGFLQHIRASSTWQLAGGYHESLGCHRALLEAHCDVF